MSAGLLSDRASEAVDLPPMEDVAIPAEDEIWLDTDDTTESEWSFAHLQNAILAIQSTFAYNLTVILLILADIVILIVRNVVGFEQREAPWLVSFILSCVFVLEVCLRMIAMGKPFWLSFLNYADLFLVLASALLYLDEYYEVFHIIEHTTPYIIIIVQGARTLVRLYVQSRALTKSARHLVGQNKMRYLKHGFDLDLTYITRSILAMGVPSTRIEGVYRNPLPEVARFFNTMHKDHYLIINLCTERVYPKAPFHGRVARFMHDDHNPPLFPTFIHMFKRVDSFLAMDPLNVVAVHCKGGKGRTGTAISALLLAQYPHLYSHQVLRLFASRRTDGSKGGKLQGVAGASQIRYIQYVEKYR